MEKFRKKKLPNVKLRYNILSVLVYVIGAILLVQLFTLQIVNGAEYREMSNTRLTRESTLYAARGNILDRNGIALASSEMTFSLEIYKTKLENKVLNDTILAVINTLEANGDKYIDTFPVAVNFSSQNPISFDFSSDDRKNNWLQKYNLSLNSTPEDVLEYFRDRYEIEQDNVSDVRKIITVRYRISSEGYSVAKSLTISNNISRKSALIFDEQSEKYPGIDVVTSSQRYYPHGTLASHILRIYKFYNT